MRPLALAGIATLTIILTFLFVVDAQTTPTIGLGGGVSARLIPIGGANLSFLSFKVIVEASLVPSLGIYAAFEYTPLVSWDGVNINASFISGGILYQLIRKEMTSYFGAGIGTMQLSGLFSGMTFNALVGGSLHLSGNLFAYAQLEATSLIGKFAIEVGLPVGVGLGIIIYL
jgi:hypothetical protein